MAEFIPETVLKRDLFSETRKGHFAGAPRAPVIRRVVTAAPFWSRPIGWVLARREIAVLRAIGDMKGVPKLYSVDRDGLFRSWTDGTPLHLARPADPAWYRDAHRLLRDFRRRGVTHNDLAKPQNWLMTPDGRAAVIDFQLATSHRRKGWLFRLMAYEDFRHLLKQKRAFAPALLSPTGQRVLARRSLPSRIWMATGKKLYNFVTRGFFRWSDGEGTHDRIEREGPATITRLKSLPGVSDVALASFPYRPRAASASTPSSKRPSPRCCANCENHGADLVQPVATLPRRDDGSPRADILQLIAMNQMTELDSLVAGDPALAATIQAIALGRLNFSDRRIARMEKTPTERVS